ncbi:hypothetical protein B0H15DRAFT_842123 [Mycena belliarum]|uniref:DUF6534 domain-containing protein n=1 Tax=Mycena belliarum TaxID=1033014 RepID=A0AAD6U2G5_9AGAR|nr:hypothetical protein B0H15DRAFT_842123 [Mycena belliae]
MAPPDLDSTYGALLIGVFVSIFFQGILSMQAYIYYEAFPEDSLRMKALVGVVWILDFVHLILICQSVYHYLVTNWGNEAALGVTTIELDLHLIFLSVATILCQGFFLRRVWIFSNGNRFLTGALLAACLTTVALDTSLTISTISHDSLDTITSHDAGGEVIGVFAVGAAVDLAIAIILCFYLQREPVTFGRTHFVVARVIAYTVATGLATSFVALACLVVYLVLPKTLIFLAIHFSLGRMYSNALLATINSRRNLRAMLEPPHTLNWSDAPPPAESAVRFTIGTQVRTYGLYVASVSDLTARVKRSMGTPDELVLPCHILQKPEDRVSAV